MPTRSDSDVMFCLQNYQGFIIDISRIGLKHYTSDLSIRINTQVIYRFALAQVEWAS